MALKNVLVKIRNIHLISRISFSLDPLISLYIGDLTM